MSTQLSIAANAVTNHMAWKLFVECIPEEGVAPLQPLFQAVVANFSEDTLPLTQHEQLLYYATCQHVWKQHIQPSWDKTLAEFTDGKRLSKMTADEKASYNTKVEAAVAKKVTQLLYIFSHDYDLDLDVQNIDISDLVREGAHIFKLFHNTYRGFEKVRTSNTQSLTQQVTAFTHFFQTATTSVSSFLQTKAITLFTTVVGHIRKKTMADFCADQGIQFAADVSHLFSEITRRIQTLSKVMLNPKPPAPPAAPAPVEAPAAAVIEEAAAKEEGEVEPEQEEVRDSKAAPAFVHTLEKARRPATKAISPNPPAAASSSKAPVAPPTHPFQPLIASLYKVIRQVQKLPKAEVKKEAGAFDTTKLFQPEALVRYAGSLGVKESDLTALYTKLKEKASTAEERAATAAKVIHFTTRVLQKMLPAA